MPNPAYAPLDDALEMLSPYGPELTNGNFNHGPMVVEALCALGRPGAVFSWIEAYRARMIPRAPAEESVDPARWQAFLGRRGTFPAWSQVFRRAIDEAPWRDILDRWLVRLAPGYSGAATHGAIRVGHAMRALAGAETKPRLRELADALASWAASYSTLPVTEGAGSRNLRPREAIKEVFVVPTDRRPPGNITTALSRLAEFPEFAPAIDLLDANAKAPELVIELSEVFTRIYLTNATNTRNFIAFVHGVTAIHALANMLPHVDAAARTVLPRYAWQAGCGLYAAFGGAPPAGAIEPGDDDAAALVDQAVANGDEHVIKFTEACLARHKIAPSPVYPAAIRHALGIVRR